MTDETIPPLSDNPKERIGQQFVIQAQGYSTRHPIFPATTGDSSSGAKVEAVGSASTSGGE